MSGLRRMPVGERRARLGLRHHLAPPALVAEGGAGGVAAVAGDLLGLHATDPSAVFMQAIARMAEVSVDDVSAALYDDRTRLATYGPVTVADAKWWSGWTAADVKRALSVVGPVEVAFDDSGAPGWVLADDIEPVTAPEPWAVLLAALDQAVMGWSGREWFLGEHRGPLFDRSGNVGPTVWWDGRIVGGWAQRNDGEVAVGLLEDVGADAKAAIDAQVERLVTVLGERRFTPKFRTPLERQLSA